MHNEYIIIAQLDKILYIQDKVFRLYWKKSEGRKEIQFGDVPFAVTDAKVL